MSNQQSVSVGEDRILTTVAIGAHDSGTLLSRDEFLVQYAGNWQELLRTGMSKYIAADGRTLSKAEGLRQMKVFYMCRNVRQRVADRMSARLGEIGAQAARPVRPALRPLRGAILAFPGTQADGFPAA